MDKGFSAELMNNFRSYMLRKSIELRILAHTILEVMNKLYTNNINYR